MKKSNIVICVIMLLILSIVYMDKINIIINAKTDIDSSAKGMVVLEGNTNTVLYGKNEHEKMPMASTTKIITAILAIEHCKDLDEKIKISDNAIGIEGTSIYIKSGEELTMRELLYGLILASGNDCAVAIAESFGGEEYFV